MRKTESNNVRNDVVRVFQEYIIYANYLTSENSYKHALSKLDNLKFTLKDISSFIGLIKKEHFAGKANYWTAGLFISAAINKIIKENETFTLESEFLGDSVDCIGYGLEQGKIILQGDAGDYLGENMSGGMITIRGNVGNYVGYAMSGGKITIEGNAANHIGTYMSGGTIHVKGQVGSIAKSCKGKICHDYV